MSETEWCMYVGPLRVRKTDPATFRPLFSERYGHTRWHWITKRLAWRLDSAWTRPHLYRVAPSCTDGPCETCGVRYAPWWADHEIWNLTMGGPDAKGDPGGMLCPNCFLRRAQPVRGAWRLSPPARRETETDPTPEEAL